MTVLGSEEVIQLLGRDEERNRYRQVTIFDAAAWERKIIREEHMKGSDAFEIYPFLLLVVARRNSSEREREKEEEENRQRKKQRKEKTELKTIGCALSILSSLFPLLLLSLEPLVVFRSDDRYAKANGNANDLSFSHCLSTWTRITRLFFVDK